MKFIIEKKYIYIEIISVSYQVNRPVNSQLDKI